MKANEAPEKIYLVIDPVWGSMSVNYNRNDTNNIEYSRTDAFIEKACEYLEYKVKIILCGDKTDTDKFINEFRKYMEGE